MKDHYNSKFALLFSMGRSKRWAVTLGQHTWYSVPEEEVNARWRRHEDWHKYQWRRDGRIKFATLYLWYLICYGYENNPYEIEARKMEVSNGW